MVLFDLTFTYVLISAQLHVYRVTYSSGAGGRGWRHAERDTPFPALDRAELVRSVSI
eukprot:COSAG05_NODE_4531_length_1475_cov_23.828488_4_plen_57_part_00